MRILYLHQYFTTPDLSGGTRSYEMARRLAAKGHDVTMITSSAFLDETWAPFPGWHEHECEGFRVEVLHLPYSNRDSFAKRMRTFLKFMTSCSRRAASREADVVFATSTPLTIAIPGVIASRKRKAPMVFEVRDLWPELPIAVGALRNPLLKAGARALERFAYRNAERVVALSPGMADGVARTGYPSDRIAVIPNSCDRGLFTATDEEAAAFRVSHDWLGDRPLVVYTGTLGLINGVSYLAETAAAAQDIDPELRFLVVGDGMEHAKIRDRAAELGVLDRNFFMLPPQPKKSLPALLRAADVATSLFLPLEPMWHNSANKYFDALAAGRPVAINYGGWQAEVLRETGAGLLLDPHDPAAAARTLTDALADPERMASMATAAAELARTRYDRDLLAHELEGVLLAAAGHGEGPS